MDPVRSVAAEYQAFCANFPRIAREFSMAGRLQFVVYAEATTIMVKLELSSLDDVSGGISVNSLQLGAAPAPTPSGVPTFNPGNPTINPYGQFGGGFDPYGGFSPYGGQVDPYHVVPAPQQHCSPCDPCHPGATSFTPGQAFDPFGQAGVVNPGANVPVAAGSAPFSALGAPGSPYAVGAPGSDAWASPFGGQVPVLQGSPTPAVGPGFSPGFGSSDPFGL
jgi:hypothetical protein